MSSTTNEMSTAEAARLLRIHPKTVLFYPLPGNVSRESGVSPRLKQVGDAALLPSRSIRPSAVSASVSALGKRAFSSVNPRSNEDAIEDALQRLGLPTARSLRGQPQSLSRQADLEHVAERLLS